MELIIYISIICLALIGFLIGFLKGFTNVKTWANDYFFATVCVLIVANIVKTEGSERFWLIAGLAVGCLILFTILSARTKVFFEKGIERSKRRSYYESYEARVENDEDILDALDEKNEKRYRRLARRKYGEHEGAMGVFSRICGGITLAIKAVVMVGILASAVFIVIDFIQIDVLSETFAELYAGKLWAFIKTYAFDFYIMGVALMCIRIGFKGGLLNKLWFFAVLALLGGAGFVSYHLAFNVQSFQPLAEKVVSGFAEGIQPFVDAVQSVLPNFTTVTVGQIIITAGLFVLLLIPVILISVFVPKLIDSAREGAAFAAIDGALGAVVLFAVVMGILFLLGAVLYTLNDLPFMAKFNEYMDGSKIACISYSGNIMNDLGFITGLPLRDWLGGAESAA